MRLTRLIILLLVLAVLFGGIFAFIHFKNARTAQFLASRANPVIAVTAEIARQDRWQDTLPAVGTLQAVNGVDVAPEVPGIVTALPFVSGQTVKTGDVLVQLDADVETANRNSAQAQLRIFQDNYDRTNKLVIGRDVAVETLVQIRFQIQAQQATVESLDALIAQKTVRAPFAGRVGINNLNLGQYVQPGTVITTLQDISSLQVEFSIGQKLLADLAPGQEIAVTSDARPGLTVKGKLTSFDPLVDIATSMIRCEGLIENRDGALLPGMFVQVAVTRAQPETVLTISQAAVSYNLFGDYVYVVSPPQHGAANPTVKQVLITPGERRGDRVAVLKGLAGGEQVVTSGQLKLTNGSSVKVDAAPLAAPNVADTNY